MKLIRELLESSGSIYFEVIRPFDVWLFKSSKPSNHYYGSARLHQPVYEQHTTSPGDQLHWLPGGLFYVSNDGSIINRIQLDKPGDFSPFEKNYSGSSSRSMTISTLRDADKIVRIDAQQAKKVRYV